MRFVLGLLSGLLGALAGWAALAFLVVSLAGPDRDGGVAMGAFFQIGPFGGFIGFVIGVLLFLKLGIVRQRASPPEAAPAIDVAPPADAPTIAAAAASSKTRVSVPFAVAIVAIACGLAWWAWYELIRSPYLTHGFMTLELQFKLPPDSPLPADPGDVRIGVWEGDRQTDAMLGAAWRGHQGDRQVILATATLSMKTSSRSVSIEFPGLPLQIWLLDLSSDPDPMRGYSSWRLSGAASSAAVEMNYRLTADR